MTSQFTWKPSTVLTSTRCSNEWDWFGRWRICWEILSLIRKHCPLYGVITPNDSPSNSFEAAVDILSSRCIINEISVSFLNDLPTCSSRDIDVGMSKNVNGAMPNCLNDIGSKTEALDTASASKLAASILCAIDISSSICGESFNFPS